MSRFFIETYGCQMNKAESSTLAHLMVLKGFEETHTHENADIVIINTCSVRKTAENRIHGRMGFYKRLKKSRKIILIVMGCMSQRVGEELINSHYGIDFVIGNYYKDKIPDLLLANDVATRGLYIDEKEVVFPTPYPEESNPAKAFVTISHGCNNFCSYCIVPYVRGREFSKNSSQIIKDINHLYEQGVKQVMLLGQNVNSYGQDTKDIDFPDLLTMIMRETDIEWVKFMSSHPKDVSDKLIEVVASNSRFSKWFHLALQSGSDRVLEKMNRKYTSANFRAIIEKIKAAIPNVVLTTDIIVGFPGETQEDYNQTLDLLQWVRFDDAFMYRYNVRESTLAQKEFDDDVEETIKQQRLADLITMQRKISRENRETHVGKIHQVLADRSALDKSGKMLGVTRDEIMMLYNGDEADIGKIVEVKATGVTGSSLIGERV